MITQKRIDYNGMSFDCDTAGVDPDTLVILLHGFPQTAYTWRSEVPALAEAGFLVVAPNQRGYSPGARPTDLSAYATGELVSDVVALADAMGRDRFHLVGHDWGGALSWLVAARHPERVISLSLLSRPHPLAFARALKETADQAHRSRHHKAFLSPDTETLLLENDARRLKQGLVEQNVPEDAVEAYCACLRDNGALTAALNWYRAASGTLGRGDPDLAAALQKIDVRTLYIWGDQDSTVGPEAARWTADYVGAAYRFEVLEGIGHFITDNAPGVVTPLLLENFRGPVA